MSCDLSLGRDWQCKEVVGGINNIYFINYGDIPASAITYDATNTDAIESISGTPSCYKYVVKEGASFVQNVQSDLSTGTTVFEQVLSITLKKLTVADHKELKLLIWGRPHVIVEDNNGNYFMAGLEHGLSVSGGSIATGAAMNEMSGYTLELTGMERVPANFLESDPATTGFTVVTQA